MATRNKRNESPLKGLIKESLSELKGEEFPEDPTLNADEITGPERFVKGQKHKDEIVIDSLLSGISGKTGYFLKLKKELRPNEWMLMKTIENEWRQWADIETAVADIVKEHTKRSPAKWGTGAYRVEIGCKGGMRGQGYDPIDVYVNAEEEFVTLPGQNPQGTSQIVTDPATQVAAQIDTLSNLVNMLGNVFPKAPDPTVIQTQIAGAFKSGMEMKASEGNNTNQMMTAMMSGLVQMMTAVMTSRNNEPRIVNPNGPEEQLKNTLETLKSFGVLGNTNQSQPKTITDTLKELRELGIDLFKKDDPLEQIGKLKQIAGIAAQFMGMGGENEKPSILEKIIDVVGPSIPGMIKDVKETMDKAVTAQTIAGQNIEKASRVGITTQPQTTGEPTTYQQMNTGGGQVNPSTTQEQPTINPQIQAFFNQLYESVKTNNRMFYPVIYTSLLQDSKGQELLQGVVSGTKSAKDLIDLLQEHGGDRFKDSEFVMKSMVSYVNGFIIWVRQMAGVSQEQSQMNGQSVVHGYDVECIVCHTIFSYESVQDFQSEPNKVCGTNGCQGILQPLVKAV